MGPTDGPASACAGGTPSVTGVVLPAPKSVRLLDGSTAVLRPTRPGDVVRLRGLFERASPRSRLFRFFVPQREIDPNLLELMANSDGIDRLHFIVTQGTDAAETVLAVAGYFRLRQRRTAEIAFMVADAYQGHGIGTVLLEQLARHAHQHGITRLVADVMTENARMLDVFHRSGFRMETPLEYGLVHMVLQETTQDTRQNDVGIAVSKAPPELAIDTAGSSVTV